MRRICGLVVCCFCGIAACGPPPPPAELVARTVADRVGCVDEPQIRVRAQQVASTYAHLEVSVACTAMRDDGSFGQSCRNLMGCRVPTSVTSDCDLGFARTTEWRVDQARCAGVPLF